MKQAIPANSRQAELRSRAAKRGKYAPLHRRLAGLTGDVWRASFREIEDVLGFALPDSARLYPAWWSNGDRHSHALAWVAAGFVVRPRLDDQTVLFERRQPSRPAPSGPPWFDPDRDWPALPDTGPWPEGFTASREQLYDDDGR